MRMIHDNKLREFFKCLTIYLNFLKLHVNVFLILNTTFKNLFCVQWNYTFEISMNNYSLYSNFNARCIYTPFKILMSYKSYEAIYYTEVNN